MLLKLLFFVTTNQESKVTRIITTLIFLMPCLFKHFSLLRLSKYILLDGFTVRYMHSSLSSVFDQELKKFILLAKDTAIYC